MRLLILLAVAVSVGAADAKPLNVLFFTKSGGFEHSVIKRTGDAPSHAGRILADLAKQKGWNVTETKDGRIFANDLARFDVFFFYTTGDLTKDGKDGAGMGDAGKAAFLDAISKGKGYVGMHSASDTFHSPNHKKGTLENNAALDPYGVMLGTEFIVHGAQQKAKLTCVDAKFPGIADFTAGFEWQEEWYSLKNFAKDLHVLLVMDTTGMTGAMYQRPNYPSTWIRMHGKGRVFYSTLGHREDMWLRPQVQALVAGAVDWAGGRVDADTTPNVDQVTPKASEFTK